MKIKLVRFPYEDHEVGEVVDLGEETNASLVEFQRAVWIEKGTKKKTSKKKITKTTAQTEEGENEDSSPARGADGKFVSKKKEEEEPEKKGLLNKLGKK